MCSDFGNSNNEQLSGGKKVTEGSCTATLGHTIKLIETLQLDLHTHANTEAL